MSTNKTLITYEEFERVDLRLDVIVKVEAFPRAKKPAFKPKIGS
jgi:tRNA-binding protein